MSSVSVVTVTLNNAEGLRQTLHSLAALATLPSQVLIVDGGSVDDTTAVVRQFEQALPIVFTSEPDRGIYDAMNKGRRAARGALIHYLNAGDTVFGEPYSRATQPCLLPVHLHDEAGNFFFRDFIRHGGHAYCHQGILFPRDHPAYDLRYRVAADLDLMIACFPAGLRGLPWAEGGVRFDLGGVSSTARRVQGQEFRSIFYQRLPWPVAVRLHAAMVLKDLVPRTLRRALIRLRSGRRSGIEAAP
jgi:glycosyltransferase involved in cell wall biosynthesis